MEVLISTQVRNVRSTFRSILERLSAKDHRVSGIDNAAWQSQFERFQMWVANTGAHQDGPASLKHRLRDASQIKQKIVDLLANLILDLGDLKESLNESTENTPGSEAESESDTEAAEAEIPHIYRSLSSNVDNLLRLSMLIRRKPAQYDRVKDTHRRQTSHFLAWDVHHVRNKFPTISQELAERLGQANTTRRGIQLYRENHKRKLRHGLDEGTGSVAPSSTQASDMLSDEAGAGRVEVEKDTVSDTSFAPSLVQGKGSITIPQPPQGVLGAGTFECPYCCLLIEADSTVEWARHVFQDIQPYQCIITRCTTPHRLYDSRSAWFYHLTNDHKLFASLPVMCPLCNEQMTTELLARRHLGRHLQELALFILPTNDTEGDTEVDEELSVSTDQDDMAQPKGLVVENYLSEEGARKALELKSDVTAQPGESVIEAFLRIPGAQKDVEVSHDRDFIPDDAESDVPEPIQKSNSEPRIARDNEPKGILKPPRQTPFPEDPDPVREGVAPLREAKGVPPDARWTKIERSLISPEALEQMHERFEEREDHVIVLRVLNQAEIEKLAGLTYKIRKERERLSGRMKAAEYKEAKERRERDSAETEERGRLRADASTINSGPSRYIISANNILDLSTGISRDRTASEDSYSYTNPREQFERDYPSPSRLRQNAAQVVSPTSRDEGSRMRMPKPNAANDLREVFVSAEADHQARRKDDPINWTYQYLTRRVGEEEYLTSDTSDTSDTPRQKRRDPTPDSAEGSGIPTALNPNMPVTTKIVPDEKPTRYASAPSGDNRHATLERDPDAHSEQTSDQQPENMFWVPSRLHPELRRGEGSSDEVDTALVVESDSFGEGESDNSDEEEDYSSSVERISMNGRPL